MEAQIERWYPLILGFTVAFSYYCFLSDYSLPASTKDLFSAIINLSGITIGFLATSKSILVAIDKKFAIKQLKNTGTYKRLINYFMDAIHWAFRLIVVTAICLLVDFSQPLEWHSILFSIWLFVLATAGFSYYRVIDIFAAILRS